MRACESSAVLLFLLESAQLTSLVRHATQARHDMLQMQALSDMTPREIDFASETEADTEVLGQIKGSECLSRHESPEEPAAAAPAEQDLKASGCRRWWSIKHYDLEKTLNK